MTQLVDQVDTRATQRLANTIGVLKIAVVLLIVVAHNTAKRDQPVTRDGQGDSR